MITLYACFFKAAAAQDRYFRTTGGLSSVPESLPSPRMSGPRVALDGPVARTFSYLLHTSRNSLNGGPDARGSLLGIVSV